MDTAQPGDLLFYRSTNRWYERLIVAATSNGNPRADFVHVAIVETERTIIEARWQGVTRSPLPDLSNPHIVGYRLPIASPDTLTAALHGAQGQVGWKYGVMDIFDQLLRLLRCPFYIGRRHSIDCSDLAACFAAQAVDDGQLYAWVLDSRQEISPNDLARYFGLISDIPAGWMPQIEQQPVLS
ncbi:MAG: hypothetical protein ACXWQR_21180 [Ktedonobacterales bacterium]